MTKHQVIIEKEKCIGCGLCTRTCVAHNIEIQNKKAEIILKDCLFCGQCSAVCPKKAIILSGYHTEQIEKKKEERLNPQEVLHAIRFRRTIRQFKDNEVSKEIVDQILEAGRLTHTGHNRQDVSFIVLDKEKEYVEKIAVSLFKKVKPFADLTSPIAKQNKIHDHFFFFHAPIVIVILAKDKTNGILAAQNMEYVAEANGLGVLYSGYFTTAAHLSFKIKRVLQVPKGKKVAMTLVLGYPNVRFLRDTLHEDLDVKYM